MRGNRAFDLDPQGLRDVFVCRGSFELTLGKQPESPSAIRVGQPQQPI